MVKSQIDTIELDLSEAEEIRGVTENTANLTKSNVTTINQLASQVSEGVLELVKEELHNMFNLISEERVKIFKHNSENLMKNRLKIKEVMTLWNCAKFHETVLA